MMLIKNFLGHVQNREVMYLPHLNLIEKTLAAPKEADRHSFFLSFLLPLVCRGLEEKQQHLHLLHVFVLELS